MAKDFLKRLQARDITVKSDYEPHRHVIRSPSPSFNFSFGNGHGLPRGYAAVLYGPPKGGKSLMSYSMAGQLHRDDPTAFVIKFDTEMRESLQGSSERGMRAVCGIDEDRFVTYETNSPADIFDWFQNDLAAMCDDGANVGMVIIDSISGIQGRRESTSESVENHQIGDHAQTLQVGFKRILPVQRRHKIAVVLTAQVRAEMDQFAAKANQGMKMGAAYAVKHYAEYFIFLQRIEGQDGKKDLLDRPLRNDELKDVRLATEGELTAHKIRATMKENSCGPRGRAGECTFDYRKGIVNIHEEIFLLAKARGLIQTAGATYSMGDKKWVGKAACLAALASDGQLQASILDELRRRDLEGGWENEASLQTVADVE